MRTTVVDQTEVTSDGRTVWVNDRQQCVARFCPISHEYMISMRNTETRKHAEDGPSFDDWESFRHGVEHRFNIVVDPKHAPIDLRS